MFCAIFSNGEWQPSWNTKLPKIKIASCKRHCEQSWYNFSILNTYVPSIFYAKIQLKISSGSGEEADFVIFDIFSTGGHLGYST